MGNDNVHLLPRLDSSLEHNSFCSNKGCRLKKKDQYQANKAQHGFNPSNTHLIMVVVCLQQQFFINVCEIPTLKFFELT